MAERKEMREMVQIIRDTQKRLRQEEKDLKKEIVSELTKMVCEVLPSGNPKAYIVFNPVSGNPEGLKYRTIIKRSANDEGVVEVFYNWMVVNGDRRIKAKKVDDLAKLYDVVANNNYQVDEFTDEEYACYNRAGRLVEWLGYREAV